NNYNISILYLWEYDINNNINLCKSLIKRYINDDKLENYNSFNWTLKNNLLTLNENIIYPYFEQNINEYRQLYIS
ncbi:MAG: hypothetical protein Q4E61_04425, partial [Alphaproteobacteria bacterium]|nr:hypothetical protein [Alphaproteobacteria bacterium]